jgi:hypothetical protein
VAFFSGKIMRINTFFDKKKERLESEQHPLTEQNDLCVLKLISPYLVFPTRITIILLKNKILLYAKVE